MSFASAVQIRLPTLTTDRTRYIKVTTLDETTSRAAKVDRGGEPHDQLVLRRVAPRSHGHAKRDDVRLLPTGTKSHRRAQTRMSRPPPHVHGKEGSTVRVRQRALQKPRKAGLLLSGALARSTSCGGYGGPYGSSRL